MKKTLALALALILCLGLLPAALAEAKEPVTIVYAYNGNGIQNDTALVNEAMNEWLHSHEGYEHLSIELVPCGGSGNSLATEITLRQASGEQLDMCNSFGISLGDYVADGYVTPMDELIKNTDIPAELPEWLLQLGSYNGVQYFVPNFQNPANVRIVSIPTEYLQYFEGGAEKIRDIFRNPEATPADKMAVMKELVLAVRQGTGKDTKWAEASVYPHEWKAWDGLLSHWIIVEENTTEAVCTWKQDWYKDVLRTVAEWYDDGIVHPDCATYTANDYRNANSLNDEALVFWYGNAMVQTPDELMVNGIDTYMSGDVELTRIAIRDHYFTSASWAAGGNWITATCKQPEEAMKIIELLNTKKGTEFFNLLVYGIEDRQYTKNGDGTIHTLEYNGMQGGSGTSYMTPGWEVGNTMNQYHNQGFNANYNELCNEIGTSDKTIHSKIAGLLFDNTAVQDEIAQINAVIAEYSGALMNGIKGRDGWEAYYEEFLQKLEVAGLQKVLDHMNAQIQDFLK